MGKHDVWVPLALHKKKKKIEAFLIILLHFPKKVFYICIDTKMLLRASLVAQQIGSLGWEDPLVKEMTTHSSSLAWRNSMIKGPGRLQSVCSRKK